MDGDRYIPPFDLNHDPLQALACTHCGCLIWNREQHDKFHGFDVEDVGNTAVDETMGVSRCTCGHGLLLHQPDNTCLGPGCNCAGFTSVAAGFTSVAMT